MWARGSGVNYNDIVAQQIGLCFIYLFVTVFRDTVEKLSLILVRCEFELCLICFDKCSLFGQA